MAKNARNIKGFFLKHVYLLSFVSVTTSTAVFLLGRDYFAKGQWALLYLLVILGVAGFGGFKAAILTAALAFFAWNYFFLLPYQTLWVSDPRDWLFLLIFLIVGIIVGLQTGRLKEGQARALSREHETDLLNKFSAHLTSDISLKDLARILAEQVLETADVRTSAVFLPDNEGHLQPAWKCGEPPSESDRLAHWSYSHSSTIGPADTENTKETRTTHSPSSNGRPQVETRDQEGLYLPLSAANRRLGVLFVGGKPDETPFTVQETRALTAMAHQASAFLERRRLQDIAIEVEGYRQADKFKSVIVSSIQHELKTPLASINATVSNLLENDVEPNPAEVKQELQAVQEDLHRLNESIGSLVELSRLESADWEPNKDWYELGEILGNALSRLPKKCHERLVFNHLEDGLEMHVDFTQLARVLQIIIENALTYSRKNIQIGAISSGKEIRIWIEDEGPGIEPGDREHVFDKFFRGKNAIGSTPGTGLGLAIAMEIIRFHGGTIGIEDVKPHGARFVITLPARKRRYWE